MKSMYSTKWIWVPAFLLVSAMLTGFGNVRPAQQVIGVWESEEKNLHIEMFEEGDKLAGRMTYFKCSSEAIMQSTIDSENPDKKLTGRKLLGLKLVTKLSYKGKNVWDDGKIYDPNSGRTFEARLHLIDANTAVVRGYWKYPWIGRSMVFKKLH